MSATASKLPLVLSLLAIALGGGLIAEAVSFQNSINVLNGRVTTIETPKTQNLNVSLVMAGTTNNSATPESISHVEIHRWEPSVLVVHKGDTVNLKITNTDDSVHSLVMPDFGIDSGRLTANTSVTKTFVADKAGVFRFYCNVPYNPLTNDCVPDHAFIVGYFVVLS